MLNGMVEQIERFAEPRVLEALQDTRVVVIQGARQVGKTTLLHDVVAKTGGSAVTLDDEVIRATAQVDPVGFVTQNPDGLQGSR